MWITVALLSACGTNTTYYTGPSVDVADVIQVSMHLNSRGEFVVGGQVSVPLARAENLGGISWDFGFETVLNQAAEKSNYLIILWQDGSGDIREDDYAIGQPFKITFEHDQWVERIEHAGQGNIIVSVEKQEIPMTVAPPQPTVPPVEIDKSFASISCENGITQVNLRRTPGYTNKNDAQDVIYKIDCGARVEILGESRHADGLTWWNVSWNGYTGWLADHTGSGREILIFNS
jgi:hypothetical protein